jgi:hypothetical protein
MTLPRTRNLLDEYLRKVHAAQAATISRGPVEYLGRLTADRPWVLFAEAGLSSDAPALAPTFGHLRNAAAMAVCQELSARSILAAKEVAAIERGR